MKIKNKPDPYNPYLFQYDYNINPLTIISKKPNGNSGYRQNNKDQNNFNQNSYKPNQRLGESIHQKNNNFPFKLLQKNEINKESPQ